QKPVFGEILMAEVWSACRFTTTDGARPPLFRSPVGNGDGNRVDLLEMVTQIISLGDEPAQMRDRLARSLARRLPKPNITYQEFVSCSSALRVTMQADRSHCQWTGFRALAELDRQQNGGNGDGLLDPRDAAFNALRVWFDSNRNGMSEPGELAPLSAVGISSI